MDNSVKLFISGCIGLVIALWLLISSVKVIGVGDVGVITRLGTVNREVNSGVTLKMPWPFEKIYTFNAQTQKDSTDADASSQDLQDVKVSLVTNYHLDPSKIDNLYRTVGVDYKSILIDPAIQESVKAVTSQFAVSDTIVKRTELKDKALASLKARLEPRGIMVEDISITNISFSAEFTAAIEQKQIAQQDAEKAQYAVQKAEQDAKAVIVSAQAQAQAQQLMKDTITPELLEKQAIDKWDGHMPQAVGGGTSIFNIPLTK